MTHSFPTRRSSDLPEILRLPTLLADPRRVARSIVTNFALCIELAGALRKIIAGRFACPTVDAGSFTRRLGCSAVRGSDMDRRIVALQRVHHLSLIATRCAGELADGGRARFTSSEEHMSELKSLMRTSYAVFCLHKKKNPEYNQ